MVGQRVIPLILRTLFLSWHEVIIGGIINSYDIFIRENRSFLSNTFILEEVIHKTHFSLSLYRL